MVADHRRDGAAHRVIAIVLDALALFGFERCMFASNFPVAGLRVDCDTLVRSVARMVAGFSAQERHAFFVGNAASFYRLDIADR
jgi:predicted TIM-barrel fold metal-dependent hydrolase